MKAKIKIAITFLLSIYLLVSLPGIALCNEDDEYSEEILFMDDFEDSFPSDNWIIISENEEYTWRQVSEIEFDSPYFGEKTLEAATGDNFIFVGGKSGYYNELLVSPLLRLAKRPPNTNYDTRKSIFIILAHFDTPILT